MIEFGLWYLNVMKSMTRYLYLFVFATLIFSQSLVSAKVEAVIGSVPLAKNPNLITAFPVTDLPEIVISRPQYIISYNKERRSPNWVAWMVDKSKLGTSGRSNAFTSDKELEKYLATADPGKHAVTPADYAGSCFDRGHQAPSGDRTDILANNEATFVMSNMIPQTQYLNRMIWEQLEQYTRDLVTKQKKKVYVIAGPIYDQDFGSIGPKMDIKVPSKDFKMIIILDENQTAKDITPTTPTILVVMPNTLQDGSVPVPNSVGCVGLPAASNVAPGKWETYKSNLQDIQKLSGLQFP